MKRKLLPAALLLLLIAIAAYLLLRPGSGSGQIATSGTVEATDAVLGFELGGRLEALEARSGDRVLAGQVLARLDDSELRAQQRQLAAQVEAARARLAELAAGFRREEVAQARAAVEAAQARLRWAASEEERFSQLFAGGAVAEDTLERAATEAEVARRELARAEEQLALLSRGQRPETLAAQQAQVAQAEAAVEAVEVRLGKTQLAAPFAGRVSEVHREPGEILAPGAPVLTLLDLDDRWVRVYVPEDRLGAVALGEKVTLRADTFPDKGYAGEVFFIADEAQFTPKSVQTREERVRLVYAVKVRVLDDPAHELKPGMPVDVELGGELAGGGGRRRAAGS